MGRRRAASEELLWAAAVARLVLPARLRFKIRRT